MTCTGTYFWHLILMEIMNAVIIIRGIKTDGEFQSHSCVILDCPEDLRLLVRRATVRNIRWNEDVTSNSNVQVFCWCSPSCCCAVHLELEHSCTCHKYGVVSSPNVCGRGTPPLVPSARISLGVRLSHPVLGPGLVLSQYHRIWSFSEERCLVDSWTHELLVDLDMNP